MTQTKRISRWKLLQYVLDKLCQLCEIKAAFLASGEGLHIASTAPNLTLDQDELSGLVIRLRKMAHHFQHKMRWAPVDEISIVFGWQHRLVARSVQIGSQELILIVLVERQSDYYQITSQALRMLQRVWKNNKAR
jgi:predicted regulator of Ras-like GTPase activity (Roadblock/LC7/MglB family)